MPKSFTDQQRDQILKKLLSNGKKLFSRFGLQKTTVDEIARNCGISKGAFYLFFRSKEELFFEIIEQEELAMKNDLLSTIPAPLSAIDICTIIKNAFAHAQSNPLLMQVFDPQQMQYLINKLPPELISAHVNKDNDFANALIAALGGADDPVETEIISGLLRSLFVVFLHKDEMEITDEAFTRLISIVSSAIVK